MSRPGRCRTCVAALLLACASSSRQGGPLSITTTSLPDGVVGVAYRVPIQVSGGTAPYSATLTQGSLPPGLALDANGGVIGGTPTVAGSSQFTVQVTDSSAGTSTAQQALSITVAPSTTACEVLPAPPIAGTTYAFPAGTEGISYQGPTLSWTAGCSVVGTDGLEVTSGTVPPGFTVDKAGGPFAGLPTAVGSYTFTVHVKNNDASQTYSIVINPAPPHFSDDLQPSSMRRDQAAGLQFFLFNRSADVTDTNIGFRVDLPAGLQVATPANATNTCGGSFSAAGGAASISLTGATLAALQNCSLSVWLSATALGTFTVSTGPIISDQGQGSAAPPRTITVTPLPPSVSGSFAPASILPDAGSMLTFAIANPNPVPLTGIAFRDSLPIAREVPTVRLQLAVPSNLDNSCGGSWSADVDAGSLSLDGGSLAANGACAISLDVEVSDSSSIFAQTSFVDNSLPIRSNEGGEGLGATASLFVQPCGDDSQYCCPGGVCGAGLVCDSLICRNAACTDGLYGTTCALPDGGNQTPCCGALSCSPIGSQQTLRYECCDGTDSTNTLCCPAGTHVDPASGETVCN